jgi:hypothetical protein
MSDSSSDSDAPPPPKPEQKATSSSDSGSDSEADNRAASPKESVAQDKAASSDDSDDGDLHASVLYSFRTELCGQAMTVRQEMSKMKMRPHKVKRTKRTLRMPRTEKRTARRRAPLLTHTSKFSATPVKFRYMLLEVKRTTDVSI